MEEEKIICSLCGCEMNYYASMLTARCTNGCGLLEGIHWTREDAVIANKNGTKTKII